MSITPIGPPPPPTTPELKKLKQACEQFEAIFAKKLLGEMRKGVKSTQFGDQLGGEIYRDMMDDAIAQSMSKQGSLGIAKMMYRDFAPRIQASGSAQGLPGKNPGTPGSVPGRPGSVPGAPGLVPGTLGSEPGTLRGRIGKDFIDRDARAPQIKETRDEN